ncbi:L,D-transpeptidase [Piscinibacter terrae]|uniref:L,D-transpeptidase n=1 Tax=Piscinibacter terrae TaxID=2496871 RepID=UPI0018E06B6C|nr:L,D-transpeptidase [Albitalea terrae]
MLLSLPFKTMQSSLTPRLLALLMAASALAATPDAQARKPKAKQPAATVAPAVDAVKRPDFGTEKPSKDALQVASWVLNANDNEGSSFVIVDKHAARTYVFTPEGKLRGAAPVLLGLTKGDETYPGVGDRELSNIAANERTTPAGRFVAEPGVNGHGVDIVWVDYEAAVSMHRVITNNPAERRLQRLASSKPAEHRISYGCINLPAAFYENVLAPTVRDSDTIIYVLPETQSPAELFGFKDGGKNKAPQTVPKVASAFYLDGA